MLALLVLVSCQDRATAFRSSLSALDSILDASPASGQAEPGLGKAFARAGARARDAADWISVLKRARRAESLGYRGLYVLEADHAISRGTTSGELLACAADAFLRGGQPEKALALFGPGLSSEARPGLWAEAFLDALRKGSLPSPSRTSLAFGRLAEVTGEARFLVDAAAMALVEGDRLGAAAWLDRAEKAGLEPAAAMLWDAGQYRKLAALDARRRPVAEQRLMADASWVTGDTSLAMARWQKAIDLDPAGSWRSYASLAAADGGTVTVAAASLFDDEGDIRGIDDPALGDEIRLSSRRGGAARLYEAMMRTFPAERAARVCYAAALARSGRTSEAEAIAGADSTGLDARELRSWLGLGAALWPSGRLAAEILRALEAHPDDEALLAAGLGLLLSRGYYEDFLAIQAKAARKELSYPREALYSAYAAIAKGDFPGAEAILGAGGEGTSGLEGLFVQALLLESGGDNAGAAERLGRALAISSDPAIRCSILKELGRVSESAGDIRSAGRYYAEAHLEYPSDTEAARLSHR